MNRSEPVRITRRPPDGLTRRILVSACINGSPIRFNRTNVEVTSPIWDLWVDEGRLVPFCAELASGFPVPRAPAEIIGGEGSDVICGVGSVLEDNGTDVTDQFMEGARLAVAHALRNRCVAAVLTDGSPSCGSTYIYDGGFAGGTKSGRGVVAQMLSDAGIEVFSEDQLEEAHRFVTGAGA